MTEFDSGKAPLLLVVDDDWMNLEVMEAYFQLANYRVRLANSGQEALRLAFEQPPDLILIDVRMQDMNGYEVCESLKRDSRTQQISVIIMTALATDTDHQRALDAGADDFIQKSFTSPHLLARVASLLDG